MSSDPPARKPPEDVKNQYKKLILREFRELQLAQDLKTKSIFDLIDYCELLYEKSVEYTDSDSGLKAYMRGYLIFNYFINCFIMLHFKGFDKFIESNEPDFILYLNVFAFYNTNDVIRDRGHSLSLELLRRWILEFLTEQKLLSFDVQELYDWLYQYIDYLKQKDQEEYLSDGSRSVNGSTYLQPSKEHDRQSLNSFEERFPSVDLPSNLSSNNGSFDFIPTEAKPQSYPTPPYPVNGTFVKSPTVPYPLDDQNGVSTDDLYFTSNVQPPAQPPVQPPVQPRPKQLPPPIPNAAPVQLETSYEPRPYMSSNQSYPHGYSQSAQYHRNPAPQPANHIQQPPHRGNEQYYSNHNGHTHKRSSSRDSARYTICGLKNFGSTCYINSTIQLLFGLHDFSLIFENQGYLKYVKNPKYVKLLQQRHPTKDSGLLSEAIFGLLKTFKDHPQASIAPTKFLRVSSLLKPDLNIPYEQQDAQEFLLFVLEMLHSELGSKAYDEVEWENERIGRYMTKWGINVSPEDREPYISWYRSLLKLEGFSPIHDLFQGHLQSKLICNKCGFESSNYSPFTILSLPIPVERGRRVDLADCLRYYTKDEILSGENAWKCPKCSKNSPSSSSVLDSHPVFETKRSGLFKLGRRSKSPVKKHNGSQNSSSTSLGSTTKKLNFIKLPKILFMHLSRFSMTSVTDKLDTVIKYPLQITFNNNTNNSNHEITYKLTGIINHYGTLKSGHYTALVNKSSRTAGMDSLRDPCWCFFDDEQVRIKVRHGDVADPHGEYRELNSRDVYVLCYERV